MSDAIRALQTNLSNAGHPVVVDGVMGSETLNALLGYACPHADKTRVSALATAMTKDFPTFGITSWQRQTNFIAQAAHETMGFATLTELGDRGYFAKYDGRQDLGNVHAGDGWAFKGRGIFQLTGRANYRLYGEKIGANLEAEPALAEQPDIAVQIACLYWRDHGLNSLADADDIVGVTKAINGGTNGLADREAYLAKIRKVWPQ